ncbi:MAG TPA: hypothetical protein VMW10_02005, partial [Alphaproteobacteria bacterium]|nr:hypothetical protein [Alphaproteobacteria bacterium]
HYIPELYRETEEPHQLCIEKHFSEKDREELSRFIDKDEDPGLRSVQEKAREFVDDKVVEVFLKEAFSAK